jgi:hypothetical protein
MALLQGTGVYITFHKPYLEAVYRVIRDRKELTFGDKNKIKVPHTPEIKRFLNAVVNKNTSQIASILKKGRDYNPIFAGYRWIDIDKSQFTSKSVSSNSISTSQQESASLYAIRVSIEDNGYSDQAVFYKKHRDKMLKIYPDMDELWENSFFEQQKRIYSEVGSSRFKHYSKDEGMMKYLSTLVRTKYRISRKDNWNPADIYLVSDYQTVKRELTKRIEDDVTPIQEFNQVLRDMFHERKIIGISLKKISGKFAEWELVNMASFDMFDDEEYVFRLKDAKIDMTLRSDNEFTSSDSLIVVASKQGNIKIQIRQDSKGFGNLKIEGNDLNAASARLGKVPLSLAKDMFQRKNIRFNSSGSDYQAFPKTEEEFLQEKNKHIDKFKKIKSMTGLRTEDEFVANMIAVFNSDRPDLAHSKLMQLDVLCEMFSLRKEQVEELLTGIAYAAQKKGDVFGPFGKLY